MMKKNAILSVLLLFSLFFASCSKSVPKIPEGYIETTFCDLSFAIPENWEGMTWDDESQNHINYSCEDKNGEYSFPLDISAYDAVSSMTDMAAIDMLILGEVNPGEAKSEKLERWGKMELRIYNIDETEQCEVGGCPAARFLVSSENGYEGIHYYVLTDNYYYKMEFNYLGREITPDLEKTIEQVINSVSVIE